VKLEPFAGRANDSRLVRVDLQWPVAASAERIGDSLGQISRGLAARQDVIRSLAFSPDPIDARPAAATLLVHLRADEDAARQLAALRELLAESPEVGARILDLSALPDQSSPRYPIEFALVGPELDHLGEWADALNRRLKEGGLVTDADAPGLSRVPTQTFQVDRGKAAAMGVSPAQIAEVLSPSVEAWPGLRVEVHYGRDGSGTEGLRHRQIRNAGGQSVPLGALVRIEAVNAPTLIHRLNGERAMLFTANPVPGGDAARSRAECVKLAELLARDLKLPDTYRVAPLNPP
jgi:multidrug efflux pump subunit AcrB